MSIGSITWIPNSRLGSSLLAAFNPAIVPFEDGYLLFYRQGISRREPYTRIRMITLDEAYRPRSPVSDVVIPKISPRIRTFDDPRAFWWRGSLWLLHTQASHSNEGIWATCIVLTQVFPDGQTGITFLPEYGRNINESNRGSGAEFEKNWTPLVIGDELFLIYQIHPMIVLKVCGAGTVHSDGINNVELVETQQSKFQASTHLSGGTPLIQFEGSSFIGMYHTYALIDGSNRRYTAGFYTVNTKPWKFTALSRMPVLTGTSARRRDLRRSLRERIGLRKPSPRYEVVFPGGLIDRGDTLDAAVGWNDCRLFIQRFDKDSIVAGLTDVS
jgi:predicted GH43/DUF377 family glycosyl hydrolase